MSSHPTFTGVASTEQAILAGSVHLPHAITQAPWEALAAPHQQMEILSILDALANGFCPPFDLFSPCLSRGSAGIALFLSYYSLLPGKDPLLNQAIDMLNRTIKRVDRMPGSQFYAGYAGVAWVVEHIQKNILGITHTAEGEDTHEETDEALLRFLAQNQPWRDSYDMGSGLVGYGIYALERVEHPTARQVLGKVLSHLEALALPMGAGQYAWATPIEAMPPWQVKRAPKGCFHLGLAHGIPSVLLLLAAIKQVESRHAKRDADRAAKLLDGGVAWLLEQRKRCHEGEHPAEFCCRQGSTSHASGRLSWLHGELGTALALLQIARLSQREEWEAQAMDMALQAAKRPLVTSGVMDASLAKGSGGNMMLFGRLYQMTEDEVFRQAAQRYLDHLIHTRKEEGPFAGYVMHWETEEQPEPDSAWQHYKPEPGLLEGAAGAGMALLAALGIHPHWDRCMMLSLPPL